MSGVIVKEANSQEHFEIFRTLCLQYYEWLGEDLCFQDFEEEMRQLPGSYGPPYGCILLAFVSLENSDAEIPAGIIALRPLKIQQKNTTQIINEKKNNLNNQEKININFLQNGSSDDGIQEIQNPQKITDQILQNRNENSDLDEKFQDFKISEVKRLFCLAEFQGRGIGKILTKEIIKKAKEMGYQKMVLDTLDRLQAANKLYQGLGFQQRNSYYHNPLDGVIFWELDLQE